MPKEWILNSALNRWGLQKKRMVGAVSDEIRKCSPKTLEEWRKYYFSNVYPQEHLKEIGKKLYVKITEVLHAEINEITEEDCVEYVEKLVLDRTFDGYMTEKTTIYEQLQEILNVGIQPAPDEWDRLFNVDFFIKINGRFIGLQIKPAGHAFITQIINEKKNQARTHREFTGKYGGKVFYVISVRENDRKRIYNTEVVDEIKAEIERLSGEPAI